MNVALVEYNVIIKHVLTCYSVKERLVSCFNQSSTCPRDYVAMLKASLFKMSEHCKYLRESFGIICFRTYICISVTSEMVTG